MEQNPPTKLKILGYLKEKDRARVEDIRRNFGLSRTVIHKHLKQLLAEGKISKAGKPPLVFYLYNKVRPTPKKQKIALPKKTLAILEKRYLYVSPSGQILPGFEGFQTWVGNIKQDRFLAPLVQEYVQTRQKADKFIKNGVIDATAKIKNTFSDTFLDKVYYADFYSLPKFGKTRLGQLVLYSKQSQIEALVKNIVQEIKPLIDDLIKKYQIKVVGFIPPTIPRKIQFMNELEYFLKLNLPKIDFAKAYAGELPVAQKSLPRLEERVTNARETIFIKNTQLGYDNILLIDDAVGSGATLNETAKKLRQFPGIKKIYGFAIVGSFKGFDVIQEV